MHVTFIGTSSCVPDIGSETASFMINGANLVDTGWNTALGMRRYGFDPQDLESIILTHMHHDHCLGLAGLLLYLGLRGPKEASARPLRIIGPAQYLGDVVGAASEFLQIPRFPELDVVHELVPLEAGDSCELNGLRLDTCAANHVSGKGNPEPALSYKVTDPVTGAVFAFSGDTSFHPPLADFARGASLLIHDAAHSTAEEAATIAGLAGVARLLLIHYGSANGTRLLAAAREVFPNTDLAHDGGILTIES
jgi:ribonuclease BN (tRNA processing enzyme)